MHCLRLCMAQGMDGRRISRILLRIIEVDCCWLHSSVFGRTVFECCSFQCWLQYHWSFGWWQNNEVRFGLARFGACKAEVEVYSFYGMQLEEIALHFQSVMFSFSLAAQGDEKSSWNAINVSIQWTETDSQPRSVPKIYLNIRFRV